MLSKEGETVYQGRLLRENGKLSYKQRKCFCRKLDYHERLAPGKRPEGKKVVPSNLKRRGRLSEKGILRGCRFFRGGGKGGILFTKSKGGEKSHSVALTSHA